MQIENAEMVRSKLRNYGTDWHSPIDFGNGVNTGSKRKQKRFKRRLRLLQIPEDLSGKRVLDIGSWDGYFALEMERRGAQVVSIDIWCPKEMEKFRFVLTAKNSEIKYYHMDVHEIDAAKLGLFDVVLCAGVLYHCRNPIVALENIRSVTRGLLILETVTLIPHFTETRRCTCFSLEMKWRSQRVGAGVCVVLLQSRG